MTEATRFSLAGRVALITGAASGIGAATAQVFAEAGADLALAWYPPDGHDIEPVRRAVEKTGRKVVIAEVDVTKAADVDALVAKAVRELGGLHIAVANAGIARWVELADHDDVAWNKVLDGEPERRPAVLSARRSRICSAPASD